MCVYCSAVRGVPKTIVSIVPKFVNVIEIAPMAVLFARFETKTRVACRGIIIISVKVWPLKLLL